MLDFILLLSSSDILSAIHKEREYINRPLSSPRIAKSNQWDLFGRSFVLIIPLHSSEDEKVVDMRAREAEKIELLENAF